jgi:molybdopterin/thiamine biosynthesis adenylyltransferase
LQDGGLVIDTFDNSKSRRLVQEQCRALQLSCLHVGLYADYGEVIWDEHYRVPGDVGGDVCDYPLARNLVLLVIAVASEAVVRFALKGVRHDLTVTLRDFAIRAVES